MIRRAPDFTLTNQDGGTVRSVDLRGRVLLVSFIFTTCSGTCPATTHRMSQVQQALHDRGLDKDVSVVVWGDFGRTPRINKDGGRDHWPQCFSAVLAGGGVRGGQVHGASDRIGAYPSTTPVRPQDLTATLYHCLGIDPHMTFSDRLGRPMTLCEGTPIRPILV